MAPPLDIPREVRLAESRIRPYVRETWLEPAPFLCGDGAQVHCKLENLQHTGSFKVRGALNKLLALPGRELAKGVVAASTGNHGAAVAHALKVLGGSGVVFVPQKTVGPKLDAMRSLGVEIRFAGRDCVEAENTARSFARDRGLTYVSPYNDPEIIGGQGTIGLELQRQLERIDVVLASLGGGGLISGIAGFLKAVDPNVKIIGCSPENSAVMIESQKAGKILDLPSRPTLSDGTAGGIEPGAITFALCRELVDDYVTVTEAEIAASLRQFLERQRFLIEGAAAVALAGFTKLREQFSGQQVVIVICGANISLSTLREIL